MMRRFAFAVCAVIGLAASCNGGRLDAFSTYGGGTQNAGGTGGSATGGRGHAGDTFGGEGGENGGADTLVIDDFEDGDLTALLRGGQWYISNDGTGVQSLSVTASSIALPASTLSIHTSGVGFESFGALLGLDIAGSAASFDASAYGALSFMARAEAGSTQSVLFAFLVGSQHFAVPLTLGTTWGRHTIPFSAALPVEDGPLTSFDPRAIAAIQFVVLSEASFDFWLDDLAFVK
jgi:hypothetical protein